MQTAPQGANLTSSAEVCWHPWNEESGECPAGSAAPPIPVPPAAPAGPAGGIVENPIGDPPVVENPIEDPPVVETPIEDPPVVENPIEDPPVVGDPAEEQRPDIVVKFTSIALDIASSECIVRYVVRNIGNAGSGPSFTHVETFGSAPVQEPTPPLAPGDAATLTTRVPAPDFLNCTGNGQFIADRTNAVAEGQEGNNTTLFP
jgi:hypothetical protein